MAVTFDAATNEPMEFFQGDSVRWQKTYDSYPTSDWTLTYTLRGPSSMTVQATVTGSAFEVNIAATDTANLLPGDYEWTASVTGESFRAIVGKDSLSVVRDPASTDTNYHSVNVEADVEAMYNNIVQIMKSDAALARDPDLLQTRYELMKRLKFDVLRNEDKRRVRRGEQPTNKIYVRFTSDDVS